jgi:hypothetical protein
MTSNESREFSQFCGAVRERLSDPQLDLATIRDMRFALRAHAAGNDQQLQPVEGGQHSFIMGGRPRARG